MKTKLWVRIRGGCGGVWRYSDTGWIVRHCGHPTALWPYYGVSPANKMLLQNGRGFRTLTQAQKAVEMAVKENLNDHPYYSFPVE